MKISRREALGAIGTSALLVQGCQGPTASGKPRTWPDADTRLLNRFGFGPHPRDVAQVAILGQDGWFREQLTAPQDEPLWLEAKLLALPIHQLSPWELRDWPERDVIRQLQTAAIQRAVYSPWQVRERLVHFWSDHFNVFARKGLGAYRKPLDERQVVRQHVFGSFPAMLKASARSAAMLVYLDQQASTAQHPNENYARELLELHTLGVKEGYTQRDVMEVARCFTGWTEERGFLKSKGSFKFEPDLHDNGEKSVLGHRIPSGGGIEDGDTVLDIVAHHPATAAHISAKLCRWYLGEKGRHVVPEVTKVYQRTGGNIAAMMTTIFAASRSEADSPVIKRPFDYLVSAIRVLEAETDGDLGVQNHLEKMGQPLYQWPMPDGYPIDTEAWSASLMARWNFAFALVQGDVKGTSVSVDPAMDPRLAPKRIFGSTQSEVDDALTGIRDPREALALCLASPAFQWR